MLFYITMFWVGVPFPRSLGNEVAPEAWSAALPGYDYAFPTDHSAHPDYKTEWWYFTGNVQDEKGRAYGYELTFFRQGVLPPAQRSRLAAEAAGANRFVQGDFKFAHFAVSDLTNGKFYFVQKLSRGAFGEAGFLNAPAAGSDNPPPTGAGTLAWIEDWSLRPQPDGSWQINARSGGDEPMALDLHLVSAKPPVIQGTGGVSQKAAGLGNASHYYSLTHLQTTGTLSVGPDQTSHQVRGQSWFDHEWASNQLDDNQVGWDWFCFQFDDGAELMLYAMRRRDGSVDPVSSGTWVEPDGRSEHLAREDFQLQPLRTWKSPRTGATYPLGWRIQLPKRQLEATLKPRLDAQELVLPLISYWEGAIAIEGTRAGRRLSGLGYMELTGYAAEMKALKSGETKAAGGRARTPR